MFTGIVERLGIVVERSEREGGLRLGIEARGLASDTKLGDSISVNGVCLTVADLREGRFGFDVIHETLNKSSLERLRTGDPVNLEASLRTGDRIGGHFVQGHVDGVAAVERVDSGANGYVLWLRPQDQLWPYIIPKGSIAVDGVSLTIADVGDDVFSVALIPTTLEVTTLGRLNPGEIVNIETDMLVRAVVNYLQRMDASQRGAGLLSGRREWCVP